ncbi:hypothetical protein Tco_1074919 [Tanacetum coccineum]
MVVLDVVEEILSRLVIKDLMQKRLSRADTPGILFNGELHWFWFDANKKASIVSFNLAKEEFREIPQPDDSSYISATSSSSSISNEQVQTLEETIRRLLDENTQMRSQNQREMQMEIQWQVEQ